MPDQIGEMRVELKTKTVSQIHIDPGNYSQGLPN
jgi:hypothetical protein